jgi:simple sugar transport system permease protein
MIWVFFSRTTTGQMITTFVMSPGGAVATPNLVFKTLPFLNVLASISAIIGSYQLVRGFRGKTNTVLGILAGLFVIAFLAWGAADKSLNLAGLLKVAVVRAVPLTLGALSGILCERSGIINIGIEGMLLSAAFTSTVAASLSNLWVGLIVAILTGALFGWVLAVFSIRYKVNQIISGTVINIFATGMTSFLSAKFLQKYQNLNSPGQFPTWEIPGLSKIPFFGPILFSHNLFVYGVFILLIVLTIALFHTKWGLRLRSAGEHPKAADTLGINVNRTRYIATILGGMIAGFGGAYFTLGSVGRFDEVMTAGRGFIGLAAMIFGNWMPTGALGAGLLFGLADSLAGKLTILRIPIPPKFLEMAPYIVTMVVLAGVVGHTSPPAAEGTPYEKE